MRLAGCTRPVAGTSAWLSMARGAKLMKPAPRSGSTTMMRAMRSCASPSSSMSPIDNPSASSKGASTHTSPGAGIPRVTCPRASGESATCRLPRKGYPGSTLLRATSLVAPPCRSLARPMVGKPMVVTVCRPSARARSTKAAGVGLSLATTASPPSNCRASRCSPPCNRSAKKPTDVSAATARVTATMSRRNSPARRSRARVRSPRRKKDRFMDTYLNAEKHRAH